MINFPEPEPGKAATWAAMADPQVGDRFTEMLAYYVYIVGRDGNTVITMEVVPPATLPKDGKVRVQSLVKFQERFRYSRHNPDYWIRLLDRGNEVDGWV